MRTFRIILGVCVDLVLFGVFVPWATVRAGRMLDKAFPLSPDINRHISDIMGIASIVSGAVWLLWAWYLLVREGHGYMTELFRMEISPVTNRLVTSGPFSVHRHPVCVGYLLTLAGFGMVSGSPAVVAVCVPVLLYLVYVYLRLFEEPALQRRFGQDYEAYAGRVPMFFPFRRNRVPVAFRNLHADRIRFAITVAGVAFSVLLICFQLSVLKGTRAQITTYIDHTGADCLGHAKGGG